MRKLAIGLLAAVGLAALAAPASAQGIYVGPGGFGVGVGPSYYDDGYAPRYRYRNYDRAYAYDPGYRRCRMRIIETRYGPRRVRRCY